MSLRILLVGNYSADMQKSMSAFAKMMKNCLIEAGYSVELLSPSIYLLPNGKKPYGFWKWVGYIDKFVLFPFVLKRKSREFDVIHICDHSNSMYVSAIKNIPVVVTCHDVLAIEAAQDLIPGWKVGFFGKIFQKFILKGLNKADAVVCVSDYTKSHLQALGLRDSNISVALNSLNADFHPENYNNIVCALSLVGLMPNDKYFIHVGSDLPRKNRLFILKVFELLRRAHPENSYKLLFVGPPLSSDMKIFLNKKNLVEFVFVTQNTTHEMLNSLYSGSVGLIFPSLQEGFGWPIIEAQASGCPVFTSNILPMTEVGGNAAIYIDPLDENIAAKKIIASLSDIELIKVKGIDNVKRFSLNNLMKAYGLAYKFVMSVV